MILCGRSFFMKKTIQSCHLPPAYGCGNGDQGTSAGGFCLKKLSNLFRLALEITQTPVRQIVYIENMLMFVQIAEGLGIRSVLPTDYRPTREKLAAMGLPVAGA